MALNSPRASKTTRYARIARVGPVWLCPFSAQSTRCYGHVRSKVDIELRTDVASADTRRSFVGLADWARSTASKKKGQRQPIFEEGNIMYQTMLSLVYMRIMRRFV